MKKIIAAFALFGLGLLAGCSCEMKCTKPNDCHCVTAPGGKGTCGSFLCPANGGTGKCPCSKATPCEVAPCCKPVPAIPPCVE